LLNQLKDVHEEVRATIKGLAEVLADANPDTQALSRIRMKLTRATGKWRTFVQCTVLPELTQVTPDQARLLAEMRSEAAEFAITKSTHISRWSTRVTEGDIAGYRRASADMRSALLARLDREAAILYPLLKDKAAGPRLLPQSGSPAHPA